MTDGVIEITAAEAVEQIEAQAFTDDGRKRVHTFAGAGMVTIGADWDADEAVAAVQHSPRVAWVEHWTGWCLAFERAGKPPIFVDTVRRPS